jgi:hypothetical protein
LVAFVSNGVRNVLAWLAAVHIDFAGAAVNLHLGVWV